MKNKIVLFSLIGVAAAVALFFWLGRGNQEVDTSVFESKLYLKDYDQVPQLKLSDFEPGDPEALSQWVTDFRVVKLDGSVPEALLGDYAEIFLSDNYIGASRHDEPFKLFDKQSGKFLRTIGKIGGGPGQYANMITDVVFDEPTDRIYLNPFAESYLLEYNLRGEFIKKIDLPIENRKVRFTLVDSVFTVLTLPFPTDSLMIYRFGFDGRIISAHPNRIGGQNYSGAYLLSPINGDHMGYFSTSAPVYYHYNMACDSIYPRFAIDQEDMVNNRYSVNVLESKESYWISVNSIDRMFNGSDTVDTWNPTGEYLMMDMEGEQKRRVRVYNDYFFNLPVVISRPSPSQGMYFQKFSAWELKRLLRGMIEEGGLSGEQLQEAIAFEGSIDEEENNYIFYGRLTK